MNEVGQARQAHSEAATEIGPASITNRVIGTKVFDRQHKYLGRVEDIVIANRIAYMLFSFGGFLGIGKTHCAAPLKALRHDRERKVHVLNMTEAQIGRTPRLPSESLDEFSQARCRQDMQILCARTDATLQELLLRGTPMIGTTGVSTADHAVALN